ncbi:MAG: hypothetical protein M3Z08_21980 [Chloroflexota bacterium]|nr:hypothetical protein [Chloroflexota bacterium]
MEATTSGIRMANWRNEVIPYEEFTVGIKRPRLDWYAETSVALYHPLRRGLAHR